MRPGWSARGETIGRASTDFVSGLVGGHHRRPHCAGAKEARARRSPIHASVMAPRAMLALFLLSASARAQSAAVAGDVSSPGPAPVATTDVSPTPDFFDVNKFRA